MELPAIAAKPPTRAPVSAVTRISKMEDPPRGKTTAILEESNPWFLISIHKASRPHNINIARKPETNPKPGCCLKITATKNEIPAILHHGRKMPAKNERSAVNNMESKNRIAFV